MRVVSYGKDDARGRPDLGRTLVDRFFGYVTADLLQRSDHRSVQALEADIRKWVATWNENPKPFIWTETAEQILGKLGRLTDFKFGALDHCGGCLRRAVRVRQLPAHTRSRVHGPTGGNMAATRRHLIALLALASSILVLPAVASSAESVCTATLVVTSGEFTDPAAWSSGSVPGPDDYACVPTGSTATLSTNVTVDGVSIDGTLDGTGTLTVSDAGTPDVSQLTGAISTVGLTISAGSLVVDVAEMSGSSTLRVSPGATARITSSTDHTGLRLLDTASVVVDGTLVLEGPSTGDQPSLYLGTRDTQLVDNGTVDLRDGADIDGVLASGPGRPPGDGPFAGIGVRLGQSGLLRSSTVGQKSSVKVQVEIAGRVDAAAGSLWIAHPVTAARSTTAVLSASGGTLEVLSLEAGEGSRATVEGTGVTLGSFSVGVGGGAGEIVVASGLVHLSAWSPFGTGSLHVMPGAAAEETGLGMGLHGGFRIINDGIMTFHHGLFLDRTSEVVNNGKLVFQDGADVGGTRATIKNGPGASITKGGGEATASITLIQPAVDNHGTLRSESGLLKLTGAFPAITGTTLTRGTYEAVTSGMLRVPGNVTDNQATILLDGPGALFEDAEASHGLRDLTDNGGTLTVRNHARARLGSVAQRGHLEVATGAIVRATNLTQTAGSTTLTESDTTLQTAGAATVTGGVLSGVGTIRTGLAGLTVRNTGRIEPGLAGAGTLSLAGRLTLFAGGTLGVDVDGTGPGDADRMDVTGPVRLAGTLAVHTGYVPVPGEKVEVLSATGPLSGTFSQTSGDVLPGGLAWHPSYGPTSASIQAAGPPD